MTEGIAQLPLNFHPTIPLTVTFDAPHVSSDGGVLLLRQDDPLRFSERLADGSPRPTIRAKSPPPPSRSNYASGSTRRPWAMRIAMMPTGSPTIRCSRVSVIAPPP